MSTGPMYVWRVLILKNINTTNGLFLGAQIFKVQGSDLRRPVGRVEVYELIPLLPKHKKRIFYSRGATLMTTEVHL